MTRAKASPVPSPESNALHEVVQGLAPIAVGLDNIMTNIQEDRSSRRRWARLRTGLVAAAVVVASLSWSDAYASKQAIHTFKTESAARSAIFRTLLESNSATLNLVQRAVDPNSDIGQRGRMEQVQIIAALEQDLSCRVERIINHRPPTPANQPCK